MLGSQHIASKLASFEYLSLGFIDWYKDLKSISSYREFGNDNDLSILKLIKLHYLAVAISPELLKTFDRFFAMPYGHVESDVYNGIRHLKLIEVNQMCSSIKSQYLHNPKEYFDSWDNLPFSVIDESIKRLKSLSPNLVGYSANQLVDISHSLHSWKFMFRKAQILGKHSTAIPNSMIINESEQIKSAILI